MFPVNDPLARFREVDRDAITDTRLHLPFTPLRGRWMAHDHAGFQNIIHNSVLSIEIESYAPMTDQTSQIDPGRLAALVGSRLCHDIVSPLGAIGNGIELLEMSDEYPGLSDTPEMQLIAASISSAKAWIEIFRIAFGQAGGGQRYTAPDLAKLLHELVKQGKLKVELTITGDFSRAEIRMLILALICMQTALPWGGIVEISRNGDNWRVAATCDRLRSDPELWAWLTRSGDITKRSPSPADVQFVLLPEAAAEAGRQVRWRMGETSVEITF